MLKMIFLVPRGTGFADVLKQDAPRPYFKWNQESDPDYKALQTTSHSAPNHKVFRELPDGTRQNARDHFRLFVDRMWGRAKVMVSQDAKKSAMQLIKPR